MIGLKESSRLMYSNTHLKFRETLPLSVPYSDSESKFSNISANFRPNSKKFWGVYWAIDL